MCFVLLIGETIENHGNLQHAEDLAEGNSSKTSHASWP
jgi:hypothetical protein